MSVLDELNQRPVLEVAEALGLTITRDHHIAPCPSCGEHARSKTDDRLGPVWVLRKHNGWRCARCDAGGSVVSLVCYLEFGGKLQKDDPRWRELIARLESRGLVQILERAPVERPREERPRPMREQLRDVYRQCVLPTAHADVSAWVESRGLDADLVGRLGLAVGLPRHASLPRWAAFKGMPWTRGWLALFPVCDHMGEAASLRARWALPPGQMPAGADKAAAAAAGTGSASGLVLANAPARRMLATGEAGRLIVTEGEPDFATWACRAPDTAVVGVWNGSWQDELAERVPSGSEVLIRVHGDEAGAKYARRIAESLHGRCELRRLWPFAQDENDRLRAGVLTLDPRDDTSPAGPDGAILRRATPAARRALPELVVPDGASSIGAERAIRYRLKHDPAARARAAELLGFRIEGDRALGGPCPACGNRTLWFFVAPERLLKAVCGRSECGWRGWLDELLQRTEAA